MKSKILTLLLIVTISLFGFVPVSYAMPGFAGGTGTELDPWQIETAGQLSMVRAYVGPDIADNHFILIADIDLNVYPYNQGDGWTPIGDWWNDNNNNFEGTFDGGGHTISGLFINMPGPTLPGGTDFNCAGLFGQTDHATIKNLNLVDANVSGFNTIGSIVGFAKNTSINDVSVASTVSGEAIVGGIAGSLDKSSITDSYATITAIGSDFIGGLAGEISDSIIRNSSTTSTVTGYSYLGGLVGNAYSSMIVDSNSAGNVIGTEASSVLGGLVGGCESSTINRAFSSAEVTGDSQLAGLVASLSDSNVIHSFATGKVASNADKEDLTVAGLVAYNYHSTIKYSYSTSSVFGTGYRHGGLVGVDYGGTTISSYSLGPDNGYGTVVTPEQMRMQETFSGWNFMTIWGIGEGVSSPYLLEYTIEPDIVSVETLAPILVPYGMTRTELELPPTVAATLNDGSTFAFDVLWDDGIPEYDGNKSGGYTFTGAILSKFGIANSNGVAAVVIVNVEPDIPVPTAPNITSQPRSQTVSLGETATFTVGYEAYPEPGFQWQISKSGGRRWSDIAGANAAVLNVPGTTLAMDGYQYRVILNNGIGPSVLSNVVTLSVTYGTADVGISKVGSFDPVTGEILWTITVTNAGPDAAQGVEVRDTLVNGTKVLSVIADGYSYNVKGRTVIAKVGTLDANSSVVFNIRALVTRAFLPIGNTATVTTISLDANLSNNSFFAAVLAP